MNRRNWLRPPTNSRGDIVLRGIAYVAAFPVMMSGPVMVGIPAGLACLLYALRAPRSPKGAS